jgi:hypothetical protein
MKKAPRFGSQNRQNQTGTITSRPHPAVSFVDLVVRTRAATSPRGSSPVLNGVPHVGRSSKLQFYRV